MKIQGKSNSKSTASQTAENRKKNEKNDRFDSAFLKKNEFALILIGALVLTVIIFFVFFNSNDTPKQPVAVQPGTDASFNDLEERIKVLEQTLKTQTDTDGKKALPATGLSDINTKITRIETAFSLKLDSMVERLERLESDFKKTQAKIAQVKKPATPTKAAVPVKKAIQKEKKQPLFHAVKKGETLYSISRKYKTTVSALRKLNKLTEKDRIYPGNNIIVR